MFKRILFKLMLCKNFVQNVVQNVRVISWTLGPFPFLSKLLKKSARLNLNSYLRKRLTIGSKLLIYSRSCWSRRRRDSRVLKLLSRAQFKMSWRLFRLLSKRKWKVIHPLWQVLFQPQFRKRKSSRRWNRPLKKKIE